MKLNWSISVGILLTFLFFRVLIVVECAVRLYIDLISQGRESLHIDRGAAEVNMAREIIKPVFSRPREIRVLSQED